MEWEFVDKTFNRNSSQTLLTERTPIPGGWLVRMLTLSELEIIELTSITFVPDPHFRWRDRQPEPTD